jgi:cystathionine beta-synthase
MLIFLIDGFTKVTDKDAAVYTRKIALKKVYLLGIQLALVLKDYCN